MAQSTSASSSSSSSSLAPSFARPAPIMKLAAYISTVKKSHRHSALDNDFLGPNKNLGEIDPQDWLRGLLSLAKLPYVLEATPAGSDSGSPLYDAEFSLSITGPMNILRTCRFTANARFSHPAAARSAVAFAVLWICDIAAFVGPALPVSYDSVDARILRLLTGPMTRDSFVFSYERLGFKITFDDFPYVDDDGATRHIAAVTMELDGAVVHKEASKKGNATPKKALNYLLSQAHRSGEARSQAAIFLKDRGLSLLHGGASDLPPPAKKHKKKDNNSNNN